MKTFFLSTAFAFVSLFATASGTKEKTIASYRTTQSLAAEFGDVDNLKWSSASNNLTRADFTVEDQQITAFFDDAGEYVASTRVMTLNDLPKKLKSSVNKKLAGQTITNILYMTAKDESSYFIETQTDGVRKVWKGQEFGDLKPYKAP